MNCFVYGMEARGVIRSINYSFNRERETILETKFIPITRIRMIILQLCVSGQNSDGMRTLIGSSATTPQLPAHAHSYLTVPTAPPLHISTTMTLDQSFVENSSWKPDIFKGKVVFVTGGAGTICRVQTEAMVLLGANAAIVGRNQKKTDDAAAEIARLRPGAKVVSCPNTDVRDVRSIVRAVERTVEQLGRIDFVIAGAAGNFLADFNHLSLNAFASVVNIDLLGSFNTVKATFGQLRKNKGAVLFVSATLHYYGVPFQIHVGAAKAGVDALSNALAVELGPLGIRSNCVAPGPIAGTEGLERLVHDLDRCIEKVPLQRLGTTRDIAEATVYLFSPAASYVTGTVHVVDGGLWHIGLLTTDKVYPVELTKLNKQEGKL